MLFQSYHKERNIEGNQIHIYKDIPKRILRKREDYKYLTVQLSKNFFFYKWEKLEGISVNYKQKWSRLKTIQKAKEFWKKFGQEIQNTFVRRNQTNQQREDIQSIIQTRSQKRKEETLRRENESRSEEQGETQEESQSSKGDLVGETSEETTPKQDISEEGKEEAGEERREEIEDGEEENTEQ